jgi:hypothetical protein
MSGTNGPNGPNRPYEPSGPNMDLGMGYLCNFLFGGISSVAHCASEAYQHTVYFRASFNPKIHLRCYRAVVEEIKSRKLHLEKTSFEIEDGNGAPEKKVSNGNYTISTENLGSVYIEIDDDLVVIKACKLPFFGVMTFEQFNDFVDKLYKAHNAANQVIIYYTMDNNNWGQPMFRTPRNMEKLTMSPDMQFILDDVKQFKESKDEYEQKAYPFKKGYLLYGATGTNKSTMAELIAYKHDMICYMVTLNSTDMTDAVLINLVSQSPPNSLIVFDEIDKQLLALQRNKTANVTIGGLLTAIDGPQRLSEGTIVLMTSNTNNFLPDQQLNALLRKGRIDVVHEMK